MEVYDGDSINMLYPYVIDDVKRFGERVRIDRPNAVDSFTAELRPIVIHVSNPSRRLVSSRPVNVAFMLAEVLWILAGRRDVAMLWPYNSNISQFSDDGQVFNAAYGYRLRHAFGHDQIEDVVRTLADDPSSRQGTMVISNPVDDKGWDRYLIEDDVDPTAMGYKKKVTKDRACNVLSHILLRNGKLDWMQVVRSNDLVWGLPYNWMQFTHLQEYIARRLGVEVGYYSHHIHSGHIYSHHFNEQTPTFDLYDEFPGFAHAAMEVSTDALDVVTNYESSIRQGWTAKAGEEEVGAYWYAALDILQAHLHYTAHNDELVLQCLMYCADPVLALTALRFYYSKRWHKDARLDALGLDAAAAIAQAHDAANPERVLQWVKDVPRST